MRSLSVLLSEALGLVHAGIGARQSRVDAQGAARLHERDADAGRHFDLFACQLDSASDGLCDALSEAVRIILVIGRTDHYELVGSDARRHVAVTNSAAQAVSGP